jgi:hypothetical protein
MLLYLAKAAREQMAVDIQTKRQRQLEDAAEEERRCQRKALEEN